MASTNDHTEIAYTTMLCLYLDDGIHLLINIAFPESPPASSDQYVLADVHASRADGCVLRSYSDSGKERERRSAMKLMSEGKRTM